MYKRPIELSLITALVIVLQVSVLLLFTQTWSFQKVILFAINIGLYLLGIYLVNYSIAKNYFRNFIFAWLIVVLCITFIFKFEVIYQYLQLHSSLFHQVLNYSISIILGSLSIYIAIHISNLHRKNDFREIFENIRQLEKQLKSYKQLPKKLQEYTHEDYLHQLGYENRKPKYNQSELKNEFEKKYRKHCEQRFNQYWDKIFDKLREVNGVTKGLPEYLTYHENLYFPSFSEESEEKISGSVDQTARLLDFLLDENNIYGFSYLFYNQTEFFTYKFRRNIFQIINGVSIVADKSNVPKRFIHHSKVKYRDLKKESIKYPTDQKLKKQLLRKYKRNITIFHFDKKRKKHIKQ